MFKKKYGTCPFCGKDLAKLITCAEEACTDDCPGKCERMTYAICCPITKGGCGATSGFRKTPKEAEAAWNKRI